MVKRVEISAKAEKDLKEIPVYLAKKLNAWRSVIQMTSLEEVRKIPGFHDEPLQGKRFGQRSVRLNRAYRLIYRVCNDECGKFVLIEEVSKHEY